MGSIRSLLVSGSLTKSDLMKKIPGDNKYSVDYFMTCADITDYL